MIPRTVKPSWPRAIVSLALISLVILIALASRGDTASAQTVDTGRFNPSGTLTFSDTTPGATSDILTSFNLDKGDINFAGNVAFAPEALGIPKSDTIPLGAKVGELNSQAVLGLLNGACATLIPVEFEFFNASVDTSDTIAPLPQGTMDALAPLAGDESIPPNGIQSIFPAPVVTKYPTYLNELFPGITPRARYAAATRIQSANLWVILQFVVFEPGTSLPEFELPSPDPALGFPSATVLQNPTIDPEPSAVTDFCSPLTSNTTLFGITQENPDISGTQGGVAFRTNPATATTLNFVSFSRSQRDADNDGFENALDGCPFHADTGWDPRAQPSDATTPKPGDRDALLGQATPDGIPDSCDPTPDEPTGAQPTDHDGDQFLNAGDNCPLVSNDDQKDTDDDGIGDACDTAGTGPGPNEPGPRSVAGKGPNSPDGQFYVCWRVTTVEIGGPNEGVVSECSDSPPDLAVDGGGGGGGDGGGGGGGGGGGDGGTAVGGATALPATVLGTVAEQRAQVRLQLLESPVAGLNLTTALEVAGGEALAPNANTVVGAVCADENSQVIPGAEITFKIDSQPGSDADLDGQAEVTKTADDDGFADTTLNVGSTAGKIVVSASGDAAGCTTKTVTVTVTEQAAGGADTGVGSLAPIAASIPAWAAIASGLGAAGLLGSLGAFARRIMGRRRDE